MTGVSVLFANIN